jgi:hypothetical protein
MFVVQGSLLCPISSQPNSSATIRSMSRALARGMGRAFKAYKESAHETEEIVRYFVS